MYSSVNPGVFLGWKDSLLSHTKHLGREQQQWQLTFGILWRKLVFKFFTHSFRPEDCVCLAKQQHWTYTFSELEPASAAGTKFYVTIQCCHEHHVLFSLLVISLGDFTSLGGTPHCTEESVKGWEVFLHCHCDACLGFVGCSRVKIMLSPLCGQWGDSPLASPPSAWASPTWALLGVSMVTRTGLVSMVTVVPWLWDGELLLMARGYLTIPGQIDRGTCRLGPAAVWAHEVTGNIWRTVFHCSQPGCRASPSSSPWDLQFPYMKRLKSSPINHLASNIFLCVTLCHAEENGISSPWGWECSWEDRPAQEQDHPQVLQTGTLFQFSLCDVDLHLLGMIFTIAVLQKLDHSCSTVLLQFRSAFGIVLEVLWLINCTGTWICPRAGCSRHTTEYVKKGGSALDWNLLSFSTW